MRQLPLEHPRLEPPVGPVLHAVGLGGAMHRVVSAFITGWVGLVAVSAAWAQSAEPAAPTPQTPAPQTSAPAAAAPEEPRGLFEQTWRQVQFGGRASSISGDPARFQRYQDLTDGVTLTDARFAH